ncbi:MAG: dienelactone hydrolase family protein [Sphingobacteriaceae bacterium]
MMNDYQLQEDVSISIAGIELTGNLSLPQNTRGMVVFAHGSGSSSRHSPRNQFVARALQETGLGTLLFDLLTEEEEKDNAKKFEISLLTDRLVGVTQWLQNNPQTANLNIGYFGASTGAAAALEAAAVLGVSINAVVSRGGRPDLAAHALPLIKAPTLLLVGGFDYEIITLNEQAFSLLTCEKELKIVEDATHLFDEPGKLEEVAVHADNWFHEHLNTIRLPE